ncbi:MurR/RpiR family transcriptional regulator [Candidatus Stoquefichus massiliensis]|uniref:MurR/RpiR family transcriptional regulator n=1 Tax=Candidatus Stoquefichus massiliensis TaxID=1470350 RepID=UPI000488ECDA|nr:MurR/RpiR family transcriptional regulator [Candidatus Stoquefichus massiliensis]
MIILDKLKNSNNFSNNEQIVAKFLLSFDQDILKLSTADIAKETYTSPATVIRLSKKLGYNGWLELRDAIATEKRYLESQMSDIDPNFPFSQSDTIQTITKKIAALETKAIEESATMVHHDQLQKAVLFLYNAQHIYIFAMANTASITYDFQYKMKFLFKAVTILNNRDDFAYTFQTLKQDDCCIFISYSGETFDNLEINDLIKQKICPSISITGYNENTLVNYTDVHFYLPPQENQYAKIGPYISNSSIHFILDVLYSCVFHKNYEMNMDKRKKYVEKTDFPNNFHKE